jgi:phytoene dehydrogenase-like protein
MVEAGFGLTDGLLSPLSIPKHPLAMARFGVNGIRSADGLVKRFKTAEGAGIIAGAAAHSMLSLNSVSTAGFGLMLTSLAHSVGWPMARGGSAAIAAALVSMIEAAGGEVRCDNEVRNLHDLPSAPIILADITPRQLVSIAADQLPPSYKRTLSRYRYGPGVFKMDWALDGPVPWTNADIARAATVHLGGTDAEVAASEAAVAAGRHPDRPYVLLVQHSAFDRTRAPEGQHTLWAYCHVPNGSTVDMTDAIERQIERFAPGFRDRVIARHSFTTQQMQMHNANYVGGDINGGSGDIRQFVSRPRVSPRPWVTPIKGLYLCSSSTPPGGGVHGMGGRAAAQLALHQS